MRNLKGIKTAHLHHFHNLSSAKNWPASPNLQGLCRKGFLWCAQETFSCSSSADHQSPPLAVHGSTCSCPLIGFKCMCGASCPSLASNEGDHLGHTSLLLKARFIKPEWLVWGPVLCRALCHGVTTMKSKRARAELLCFSC